MRRQQGGIAALQLQGDGGEGGGSGEGGHDRVDREIVRWWRAEAVCETESLLLPAVWSVLAEAIVYDLSIMVEAEALQRGKCGDRCGERAQRGGCCAGVEGVDDFGGDGEVGEAGDAGGGVQDGGEEAVVCWGVELMEVEGDEGARVVLECLAEKGGGCCGDIG